MTANPNIASEGHMNYKNITVAGSGVLGSQIAFQTAYKGFYVNVYDISDQVLGQAKERQQTVDEAFSRRSKLISIPNSGNLPRRKRSLQQIHPLCCRVSSRK